MLQNGKYGTYTKMFEHQTLSLVFRPIELQETKIDIRLDEVKEINARVFNNNKTVSPLASPPQGLMTVVLS